MTKPNKNSSQLVEASEQQLQMIIQVLNSERDGVELRRLIALWQQSGPDLRKMLATEKALARPGKAWLLPVPGIGGKLVSVPPHAGRGKLSSKMTARVMFTALVVHPQLWKFARHPCLNCAQWFLKKTRRERAFCSKKCATNATQIKWRDKKRRKMLQRAREAIREYPTRAECWRDLDWKEYAVRADYRVSKKFLTLAVEQGDLRPPTKESK